MRYACQLPNGGSAPATPGFNAVAPEWLNGAAAAAPAVPAAESTLGSHPCVALSSAQVLPEWTTSTPPCNDFLSYGGYPLNFVSHDWGSLQVQSRAVWGDGQPNNESSSAILRRASAIVSAVVSRGGEPRSFSPVVIAPDSISSSCCRSFARSSVHQVVNRSTISIGLFSLLSMRAGSWGE